MMITADGKHMNDGGVCLAIDSIHGNHVATYYRVWIGCFS